MSKEVDIHKRLILVAFGAIIGSLLFFILSILNMHLYPGSFHVGSSVFPSDRYSLKYNNLSDMGMLYTFTGEPNFLSAALFAFTLTLTGTSFLLYVRYFPHIFNRDSKSYKSARTGSMIGIVSSAAFIGIGWTPWDVLVIPHMIFVLIGFLLTIVFNIFFAIAIFQDKNYPNGFAFTLIFYDLLIITYIMALILGPSYLSIKGRIVESLGQKIVIYTQMVLLILNAMGFLWVLKKKEKEDLISSRFGK